jgi:hypothetical protein
VVAVIEWVFGVNNRGVSASHGVHSVIGIALTEVYRVS